MSLIGTQSAVDSLGVSCQTVRQIRLNHAALSACLGDTLHPANLPFDWMFAPPDAAARLLTAKVRVPPGRGEPIRAEQPFWARHGLWLWHAPIANDADFAAMQECQTRRWARWDGLASLKRRVFVVSNTQKNLDRVANAAPQRMDFRLTNQRMSAIAAAVTATFGAQDNAMLFVADAERLSRDAHTAGFPLAVLEPDKTDHEGNDPQWSATLEPGSLEHDRSSRIDLVLSKSLNLRHEIRSR